MGDKKVHKIYIVLTYTGTMLSKIVKFYTRKEYSHVSIALDENLSQMYSFGRLNPYNPFIGGFVQESPKYGTFKRFSKTKSKIYSIEVTEEQYAQIKELITEMSQNKNEYHFNVLGLFAVALHIRIKKENTFYCAEFVKYVLDCSNIDFNLPDLIKPCDFNNLSGGKEIYRGRLNEYNV